MARREPVRLPRVRLATARPPRAGLPAAGWEQPRPAKTTGGGGTDPGAMEAAIMEALVLWYDPRRQGATNESMAADPHLVDLSGGGHDAKCQNFAWTEGSGISAEAYPGALVADGVDDMVTASGLPLLEDFTVVAEREFIRFDQYGAIAFKKDNRGNGAFIFEMSYNKDKAVQPDECWVFSNVGGGGDNDITPAEGRVSWMTPASYNGQPLSRGVSTDKPELRLFYNGRVVHQNCAAALWSFLLFDRTLSGEEIEWVKEHLMGEPK